eukprot:TRINITY_DN6196_c0_g1_i1.p1 TRINITY_DN6196_c0_g1~~TRINITY_DN6196_c0_g1_i1.p1  ORF type:complete len:187 (-),score=17.02 TRINITY_DN6196_c0_g1_i1:216-716(-)
MKVCNGNGTIATPGEVDMFLRAQPLTSSLPDNCFKSSSQHDENHSARKSRLNYSGSPSFAFAVGSPPHWIEVSLPMPAFVTGVATQARPDCNQRVTKYRVSCSLNGTDWEFVPGIYIGNVQADKTVQRRDFPHPVHASFVRLHAESWEEHPSLRWEVYGVQTPYSQ